MAEETKRTKERSPNFPYITLESALGRARDFYAREKRSAAPFEVAAEHWGLRVSSSSALQTVAALKSYGLMVDEGRGPGKKVRLTDLALRIVLDDRPDSAERSAYMRQAAKSPAIVAEVHEKWPDGLPSPSNLRHFLVLERGFNSETVEKAVRIIYENQTFTGENNSSVESDLSANPADVVGDSQTVNTSIAARPAVVEPLAAGARTPPETLKIGNKGASITINFGGSSDREVFEFIKKYGEFRFDLTSPDDSE